MRRRRLTGVAAALLTLFPLAATGASEPPAPASRLDKHDVAYTARADHTGYHLYRATGAEAWAWRPVASILPGGNTEEEWQGHHCVTGDGRHVVAVLAPRRAANVPALSDHGAFAYVVDGETGEVRPVVKGVALRYHTPTCGAGSLAAIVRYDGSGTDVLLIDATSGSVKRSWRSSSHLTSVAPVGSSVIGVEANQLVRASAGGWSTVATLPGLPYRLRPNDVGGVDFLVATASSESTIWRFDATGARRLGVGPRTALNIFSGRRGRGVVVGASSLSGETTLRSLQFAGDVPPQEASIDGGALIVPPPKSRPGVDLTLENTSADRRVDQVLPASKQPAFTAIPRSREAAMGTPGSKEQAAATAAAQTPVCAVPRNDIRRQVPQVNAPRINWAIQQATRNLLKGTVLTRPANYLNTGIASYQPSLDFPRRDLHGWAGVPVPPSVIQAVFAQESNWKQASRRALPGEAGNPNIADYYGANGTIDQINYAEADCGYGVAQVTDPMRIDSPQYTANGKTKVALDYAENVAAGIQFLVDKWNQAYDAGVTLNNKDPRYLENWYFAIWAYNTGFHAFTGAGQPWGVGWVNNPINPNYCPCRSPFLRTTYADAEHPSDWPYQERVFGWMETPLLDYKGVPAYQKASAPSTFLNIPGFTTFCSLSNECNPTDPTKKYCLRSDFKCWWHEHVNYANCPSNCAISTFTTSTTAGEPADDNNYAPNCNLDAGDEPNPATATIVDNEPTGLNVEGCNSKNWTTKGTFSVTYGTNAAGDPLGVIDWHQLGTGFGGHTWFTKNRAASDTAHINTATWTPPTLTTGIYNIKAHIPVSGATTSFATYRIYPGDGTFQDRTIDQHLHVNRWVPIGNFTLRAGAKVVLTNATIETPGTTNVGFDALSFERVTGTIVKRTFDAIAIFDENQRLDTDSIPPWENTPLRNMQTIYDWGRKLTLGDAPSGYKGVGNYPVCPGALLQSPNCVGSKTSAAYATWGQRVQAAGNAPKTPQGPDTQAKWLALSNTDPPATLTSAFIGNPDNYKVRTRVTVEFMKTGTTINPSSVVLSVDHRAGNTHLPAFVQDIMKAYRDDYGIALPNLTYQAVDLLRHTHGFTTANPAADGKAPGRANFGYTNAPQMMDANTCVRVKTIGGGLIGYKPMVLNAGVRAAADAWRQKVVDLVNAGKAPQVVADGAEEIRKVYFKAANVANPLAIDPNSPFWVAPAIWIQSDVKVCADGRMVPGSVNIADSSYMPDLYLYRDNAQIDLKGNLKSGPAQLGDYTRFSRSARIYPGASKENPWDPCVFATNSPDYVSRRNGSPWPDNFTANVDESPNKVRHCDEGFVGPFWGFEYHYEP